MQRDGLDPWKYLSMLKVGLPDGAVLLLLLLSMFYVTELRVGRLITTRVLRYDTVRNDGLPVLALTFLP